MTKSELRQMIREVLKEELSTVALKEATNEHEKLAIVLIGNNTNKNTILNKVTEPRHKIVFSVRDFIREFDNTRYKGFEKGTVKFYADTEGMQELKDVLSEVPARVADTVLKATTVLTTKITEAMAETDFDTVIKQIKADLLREIKPTPVLEDGEFYEDFKDIYLSWPQWDETNYRKDFNFQIAYNAVENWVEKHVDRYPGFRLNFLEPLGLNDYFITINVYYK